MEPLVSPIAVFDAGIGGYAIVDLIHRRLPRQDIVNLADRASFPYGSQDRVTLLETMRRTIGFLERYSPSMIVIASNAPSIMVLDALNDMATVPVRGIRPPLAEALRLSATGRVGIMAVRSLIGWPMLKAFVHQWTPDPTRIFGADIQIEPVKIVTRVDRAPSASLLPFICLVRETGRITDSVGGSIRFKMARTPRNGT